MNTPKCSAIILAGGRATRLGGVDKALVNFQGRALISHVIERVAPQVDDITINSNRHDAALQALGYPLIADIELDYSGPLMGILSALPHCRHPTVLITPCDTPFLPRNLYARLNAALAADIDLVVARDEHYLQPLFMLMRAHLLPSLRQYHAQGLRKVEAWCKAQRMSTVLFTDVRVFSNMNTQAELDADHHAPE